MKKQAEKTKVRRKKKKKKVPVDLDQVKRRVSQWMKNKDIVKIRQKMMEKDRKRTGEVKQKDFESVLRKFKMESGRVLTMLDMSKLVEKYGIRKNTSKVSELYERFVDYDQALRFFDVCVNGEPEKVEVDNPNIDRIKKYANRRYRFGSRKEETQYQFDIILDGSNLYFERRYAYDNDKSGSYSRTSGILISSKKLGEGFLEVHQRFREYLHCHMVGGGGGSSEYVEKIYNIRITDQNLYLLDKVRERQQGAFIICGSSMDDVSVRLERVHLEDNEVLKRTDKKNPSSIYGWIF